MSMRSGSGSLRLRSARNADVNENSDPYSSSAVVAGPASQGNELEVESTDGNDTGRRPSRKWNHAMDLIANLPSRQLSLTDDTSSVELRRTSSANPRRQPSVWNALANQNTRRRLLSRQRSFYSDVEDQRDNDQSDNKLTEEEQWEKCQTIRDMAASMQVKRQRKAELMQAQTLRLSGYDALKFHQNVILQRRKEKWNNFKKWFHIWDGAFKTIDGQFGMGVGSYFRFLKWLLFLNIYILMIILGSLILPQAILLPASFEATFGALNLSSSPATNLSGQAEPLTSLQISYLQQARECSAEYQEQIKNLTGNASIPEQMANVLQGKGYPENTFLFYGHYFNKTYYNSQGETDAVYIMPLAYILTTAGYFILSLILMVRNSAKGFKENFVDSQSRFFQYSCKVFSAWDFCMTSDKACKQKRHNLFREFKHDMETERIRAHLKNRSRVKKCVLFFVRILINIFVLITLTAAGVAIYYVNEKSLEWSDSFTDEYLLLAIQYAPSICITLLNAIIPLMFIYIVQPEDYSPEFEIKITLVRTVFLRLASLAVLLASLFGQIYGCDAAEYRCGNCAKLSKLSLCWETYVGQQFYKLAVMDFVICMIVPIIYEFPRRKCVTHFKDNKVFKMIGLPQFDIPRSVLDLIYGQTLCWIGAFFCPIIPVISVVKLFLAFYLKKVSLLRNFVSSARTYRASKSNSFFTIVLLVSFVLTTIPVGYSIGKIPPSQSCGPFRVYSSQTHYMFSTIGNLIYSGPAVIGDIFYWLGSVSFIAPLIIVLCIAMYYYYIVASGHKRMIEVLKDQLAMEGRDKRFLIDRVNEAMTAKYGAAGK